MKTDDKKRGCGPGDLGHCIVSVPRSTGPRGPLGSLIVWAGSGVRPPAGFPEKNSGPAPEGLSILAALGPVTRHCGVPQWP